eukprot:GHVR01004885.1.p2 GENE.GHVR01004885.1~~GHVR01004885.1.p2  ORF type:complete len:104 (+),score=43.80 GHVR01004885.1:1-312(+)
MRSDHPRTEGDYGHPLFWPGTALGGPAQTAHTHTHTHSIRTTTQEWAHREGDYQSTHPHNQDSFSPPHHHTHTQSSTHTQSPVSGFAIPSRRNTDAPTNPPWR